MDTALKIAKGLGVSLNDLIIGYSDKSSTPIQVFSDDSGKDGSEYFLQIIKENIGKLSDKDLQIEKLEKEINLLKKQINEELKSKGIDKKLDRNFGDE